MHDGKAGPISEAHKGYLADVLASGRHHLLDLITSWAGLSAQGASREAVG